jgi:uncharacterized YigZ family protein
MDPYPVPSQQVRSEIVINKSRFIANAAFSASVDEAKLFVQSIRDEMPDASHHVYGFRVGYGSSVIEGMSDDREPSGTAGPPILSVLRGSGIGDICVVVTRYFGGTKLGTGGLVRAYSEAARMVLETLPTEMKIARTTLLIESNYSQYARIKLIVEKLGEIIDETFTGSVTIQVNLPTVDLEQLQGMIREETAGSATVVIIED